MAMLKTIGQGHATRGKVIHKAEEGARLEVSESGGKTGHVGSCKNIDDYLWEGPRNVDAYLERGKGRGGRPLAFRHTDELDFEGEHGWWRVMDEERRAWGQDDGRTYYHFVISPDPRDHVGADELADLALEWVRRCLPGTQAVVSVHDDNEGHIMHAHVIVNSVIPSTGRKVHRSNRDVKREAEVCQELCREHGLAAMPTPRERRRQAWSAQWAKAEAAERRIEARGGRSWKADIRRAVDECVREATTWRQFVRAMGARGFRVRETRRGDLTYYHPDSTGSDKRVRACRLGMGYDAAGVRARLAVDFGTLADGGVVSVRPRAPERAPRSPRESRITSRGRVVRPGTPITFLERLSALSERRVTADRVMRNLRALATIRAEGIRTGAELMSRAAAAEARVEALEEAAERNARTADATATMLGEAREAARLREEISRLPRGVWSLATRKRRNELEARAKDLEGHSAQMLASARGTLERLGVSGEGHTDVERWEALMRVARRQVDEVARQVREETGRLEAVIDARRVVEGGRALLRPRAGERPGGPLRLDPGVRVDRGVCRAAARDESAEDAAAVTADRAARARQARVERDAARAREAAARERTEGPRQVREGAVPRDARQSQTPHTYIPR